EQFAGGQGLAGGLGNHGAVAAQAERVGGLEDAPQKGGHALGLVGGGEGAAALLLGLLLAPPGLGGGGLGRGALLFGLLLLAPGLGGVVQGQAALLLGPSPQGGDAHQGGGDDDGQHAQQHGDARVAPAPAPEAFAAADGPRRHRLVAQEAAQ